MQARLIKCQRLETKKHLVEVLSECTQNVSQSDTLSIIHSHTHAKIYKDYTCIRTYNMYVP